METVTLSIPNISCHHCIMTVQRETGFVEGAEFVSADLDTKQAVVKVKDQATLQSLKETLAEAGYPVV